MPISKNWKDQLDKTLCKCIQSMAHICNFTKTTGNTDQINENEWKMNGKAERMRITMGPGKDKILSISPYIIKFTVLSMSPVLNTISVDRGKHM